MAKARPQPWTVEEFLAFEAEEAERYEFVDGIVRMMTGGSAAHSRTRPTSQTPSTTRCARAPAAPTSTTVMYPDVVVVCGPLSPDDDRVLEPAVVVEVVSPTTETHDRVRKWRQYQTIPSLRHFVLVAQSERRIEVYTRKRDGWQLAVVEPPEDGVTLGAVGASHSLEGIYEGSGR